MTMPTIWRAAAVAACALGVSLPAAAVRAIDAPPPTREAVRNTRQPAPLAQADDRSGLRQGVIGAISPDRQRLFINGSWLAVVDGRSRLFRQGQPVGVDALVVGQAVRFNLALGAEGRSTLGVVYVP